MSTESKQSEAHLHALDYWQVIRNRYGVILLAFFLVFMTAVVITYMLPNQYLGRVQLEIEKESMDTHVFNERSSAGDFKPYSTFMQTQFEIICSKETLSRVIKDMNLVAEWNLSNEAEAFNVLKGKLDTQPVRGTDLMNIEIFHTDENVAAELANKVANAYQERRRESELNRTDKSLASLNLQIQQQRDKVEAARIKMIDMMEKYDIVDVSGDQPEWMRGSMPESATGGIVIQSERDVFETKKAIDGLTSKITTLQGLEGDAMIESAAMLGIENPTLQRSYPEYQNLKLQLSVLRGSGLGAKHPDVLALEKTIMQTGEMLDAAVVSSREALSTQLKLAQNDLDSASSANTDVKRNSIDERRRAIEYVEAKKDYDLHKSMLNNMQEMHAKEMVNQTMPTNPIVIHERAVPNPIPAKPNVKLHLALGAVVGLVFGIGLAFFLEYLDTSVKSLEDVERYLEVPVLAVIPKDVGVLHKQSGLSPDAEAYRILRTNIEFNRKSADANAITVVSGGAGEGKSTTLVNLAYICAQGGYNTLMIDGDLRRPRLHTFFDINNSVGLTNYLTTDLMLEDVILQTPVDNLYFMPSGILPADAAGILNSRRMSELIADVKSRFDLVLIDSPPILGVSDASVLASECDLTMIVIQHRKLPRSMLVRVKQAIENVGGTLLGVVLNNVDVRSDSQYQYYTSYYTYYSPTNTESKVKSRIADSDEPQSKKRQDVASAPTADSYDDFEDDQY
jgi:succinoglycan biosynthesis transport protein ExoP